MTEKAIPLVVRRLIPCEQGRVFDAFSRSDALAEWFKPNPEIGTEVLELDFRTGGTFRFRYTMPGGRSPVVSGVYQSIERPDKIVMSWIWEEPDPLANIIMEVTFAFLTRKMGTEVIVTHTGIPSDLACTVHEAGWDGSLQMLERFVGAE